MRARPTSYLLFAAVLVLLLAAFGCSRGQSDAQIANAVITRINSDAAVPTKQVRVSSANGVVTLSGIVASDSERTAAAADAGQVEGVRVVVNDLAIDQAAAPAAQLQAAQPPEVNTPAAAPTAGESRRIPERRAARRATTPRRKSEDEAMISFPKVPSPAPATSVTATSTPTPAPAPAPAATPVPVTTAAAPIPPPPPSPITVPDGTTVSVRMIDGVDTAHNQAGDTFRAVLDAPIMAGEKVAIPQGASILGRVAELKGAGHFTGKPQLALELANVSFNGRKYALQTNQYTREGSSRGSRTAKTVGGGAALGAILGGIFGGGKGAVIGAAAGAGAGSGVEAISKPQQIRVSPEALLSFRLENSVTVTPASSVTRASASNDSVYNDSTSASPTNTTSVDQSDQSIPPDQSNDDSRPVLKRRPPPPDNTPQ